MFRNLHSVPSPHHTRNIVPCCCIAHGLTVSFTLTEGPMGCYGKWQCASFRWRQSCREALRGIMSFCQPCYPPTFLWQYFFIERRCSFTLDHRMRSHLSLNTGWDRGILQVILGFPQSNQQWHEMFSVRTWTCHTCAVFLTSWEKWK